MPRALGVLVAIVLFASIPQPSAAANVASGDGMQGCPGDTGSRSMPAQGRRPRANRAIERAPDAVRVLPGANMPFIDLPEVSSSIETYSEGGLTHTIRTTVRAGRVPTSTGRATTGGHRASLMSGACTLFQREVHKVSHTICGGGCLIQYLQRTVDRYSNPNRLNYWDRVEVRIWWERLYSTGLYFTGDAYTRWDEGYAFDCNGDPQGRIVYSYTTPAWYTWDRTYDYYWTEYQLPTVTPTLAGPVLRVSTTTPESYGPNLYTQVDLQ